MRPYPLSKAIGNISAKLLICKGNYSTNNICFRCMASKNLDHPYTDVSAGATWRATLDSAEPWDERPTLADAPGFTMALVSIDLMHTFHLGLARNVIASIIVVLLRTPGYWPGRTMQDRLLNASRLAKSYASSIAHRAFPRKWMFTRARLGLKSKTYAEFHGKAWMAAVLLQWLEARFAEVPPPSDDMFAVVSLANNIMPMMISAREQGSHLTHEQAQQIQVLGAAWLQAYLRLHVFYKMAGRCPYKLFNPRPKLHMFQHLLESCAGLRNPAVAMTFMDEDWLKRVLLLTKKVHKRTAAVSTLLRWLAGLQPQLERALAARPGVLTLHLLCLHV